MLDEKKHQYVREILIKQMIDLIKNNLNIIENGYVKLCIRLLSKEELQNLIEKSVDDCLIDLEKQANKEKTKSLVGNKYCCGQCPKFGANIKKEALTSKERGCHKDEEKIRRTKYYKISCDSFVPSNKNEDDFYYSIAMKKLNREKEVCKVTIRYSSYTWRSS
jgi:hypothetical protein